MKNLEQNKKNEWVRKLSPEDRQKIKELFVKGSSIPDLSILFKVDRKTIYYHTRNILLKNGKVEKVVIEKSVKKTSNPTPKKYLKLPKEKSYKDYLMEEKRKIKERGGINYLPSLKDLKS